MVKSILLVGIGGGIGSIARYLTSAVIQKFFQNPFPFATFSVNVLGCLIVGVLVGLFGQNIQVNKNIQLLLITGFCGGFTTFSTFASESFLIAQKGNLLLTFMYVGLSIFVGFLALWVGLKITH